MWLLKIGRDRGRREYRETEEGEENKWRNIYRGRRRERKKMEEEKERWRDGGRRRRRDGGRER
jgi:hypothetical protein